MPVRAILAIFFNFVFIILGIYYKSKFFCINFSFSPSFSSTVIGSAGKINLLISHGGPPVLPAGWHVSWVYLIGSLHLSIKRKLDVDFCDEICEPLLELTREYNSFIN